VEFSTKRRKYGTLANHSPVAGCGKRRLWTYSRVRKKDGLGPMEMWAFRTLDKRWLLSFTSLPPGETRVREQAKEILFAAAC